MYVKFSVWLKTLHAVSGSQRKGVEESILKRPSLVDWRRVVGDEKEGAGLTDEPGFAEIEMEFNDTIGRLSGDKSKVTLLGVKRFWSIPPRVRDAGTPFRPRKYCQTKAATILDLTDGKTHDNRPLQCIHRRDWE